MHGERAFRHLREWGWSALRHRDKTSKRKAAFYAANQARIAKERAAYRAANWARIAQRYATFRAAKRLSQAISKRHYLGRAQPDASTMKPLAPPDTLYIQAAQGGLGVGQPHRDRRRTGSHHVLQLWDRPAPRMPER